MILFSRVGFSCDRSNLHSSSIPALIPASGRSRSLVHDRSDTTEKEVKFARNARPDASARKGGFGLDAAPGNALFKRLREHANSITETENLDVDDFLCRYLVSDDIWIPLGESLLIQQFEPLWNVLIDGFGIHTPGKNRPQQRSKWDTLHPGRRFAVDRPKNALTARQIMKSIADYLEGKSVNLISPQAAVTEEESDEESP